MKKNPIKTLLVLTGFTCNNNCLVCSVGARRRIFPDRSFSELENDLKKGRREGFSEVEFTGGEPTIRKDIIDLVKCARDLGYRKISLSTNGRLFSYNDFTNKIIKAGLSQVTFSLLGASNKIHDAVTRTPGSFNEIVSGIKNVKKNKNTKIKISTAVSRLNYKDLENLAELIISLAIKHWYILDLIPDGNAKEAYEGLAVKSADLRSEIEKLQKFIGNFTELGFFDFPFCLFAPTLRARRNLIFINSKKRNEISAQIGYNPSRIASDGKGGYTDKYKAHLKICEQCQYHNECGGVWKEYLELFGEEEIAKLVEANKIKLLNS